MLSRKPDAAALWSTNNDRYSRSATIHEPELCGLIDDHVHHLCDEVEDLNFDYWAQTCDCSAHSCAAERSFRDWRVAHTFKPELV